ncbi:MAG TPA: hypothetical protein VF885_12830 [Arthrobacter sp.]
MSDLNIRQGYRLGGGVDLFQICEQVRAVAEPIHREIQLREIAQQAAMILDQADLDGSERPASVVFAAFDGHNKHIGQIVSGEHDCATTRLSLSFGTDPETGIVYALADTDFQAYADALIDMEFGTYFPYWNEAEGGPRPFGIRSADWESRAAIWNRVLRGADAADPHSMLRLDIGALYADIDLLNDQEAILAAMPNMGARINVALNRIKSMTFESPGELVAFMSSMPAQAESIRTRLRPITLEDLTGVAP